MQWIHVKMLFLSFSSSFFLLSMRIHPPNLQRPQVGHEYRGVDTSQIKRKSGLFHGLELCVSPSTTDKAGLELLVAEHGGALTQAPKGTTHCIVASKADMRVNMWISTYRLDVVKPVWVRACVEQNRILEYRHHDLIHQSSATANKLRQRIDRFGDSYTEDLDVAQFEY